MTKNEIIHNLFTGSNFNDCINKMEPAHLREDLTQEVMVTVCEWDAEKITGLYQEGKLEFYVVRVIINMLSNKYSRFYKKFRQPTFYQIDEYRDSGVDDMGNLDAKRNTERQIEAIHRLGEEDSYEERLHRELTDEKVLKHIDNLYWYNKELIQLYVKHGNFRAIEKETGIPFTSCYKTIQKSFEELRQMAKDPASRPMKGHSRIQNQTR